MKNQKKCMFASRGEKHKLIWVRHITTLSELSCRCLSPRFETTENIEWKISLWTGSYSGEDHVFCTVFRMLDDGPSKIHYFVHCKLFIRQEDIGCQRQPFKYKIFSKGSTLDFRLLSAADIRKSVGAYLSTGPVKLSVQILLQRKSFETFRPNRLNVSTELEVLTVTEDRCFHDHFYQGKEKDHAPEKPNNDAESNDTNKNDDNWFRVRKLKNPHETLWHPVFIVLNQLNFLCKCRSHFLDVNSHIHASSKLRIYESTTERVKHPVYIMKTKDSLKQKEILSRDGEITIRTETTVKIDKEGRYWEWAPSRFLRRNVSCDLRNDLKHLLWNCTKGANLLIRANGEVFKVHKEVLVSRSPVFNAMLSNSMTEKLSNVIHLQADSVTLKNFLKYLYFGAFDSCMEWKEAYNLYVIADQYFVYSLRHVCSRQLISRISLDNWEQLLALSRLFNDNELHFAVASFNSICTAGYEPLTTYRFPFSREF